MSKAGWNIGIVRTSKSRGLKASGTLHNFKSGVAIQETMASLDKS